MDIIIGTNKYCTILEKIQAICQKKGFNVTLVNNDQKKLDIFDCATKVAFAVSQNKQAKGIIIDDDGQGSFLIANKLPHTVVATVYDDYSAEFTSKHNNANIICLGVLRLGEAYLLRLLNIFLDTPFDAGRHLVRTDMLECMVKA